MWIGDDFSAVVCSGVGLPLNADEDVDDNGEGLVVCPRSLEEIDCGRGGRADPSVLERGSESDRGSCLIGDGEAALFLLPGLTLLDRISCSSIDGV
jgi:hypothetical protein